MSLKEWEPSYKIYLDRTIVMYGESGTGKSILIKDIMHTLADHIDQILVISPTDRQNHTYDRGIVPLPWIHYTLTAELLDNIWNRQTALSIVYSRSNNPEVLKYLFYKIPNLSNIHAFIKAIYDKLKESIEELEDNYEDPDTKAKEMKDECDKLVIGIYKKYITENASLLESMRLTPEESYALKYHNLNPRLLLIFDDCTELLTTFAKHPVLKMLFTQGRWAHITAIVACHNDKAFTPDQKKGTFVTIFTHPRTASAYIERDSTNFDKTEKKRARDACTAAFTQKYKNQKLVYVRDVDSYFKYTARLHDTFRFGSQHIWDYSKEIEAPGGGESNNKFLNSFH